MPDGQPDQEREVAASPRPLNLDPKLYAAICKAAGIDPADQAGPDDDFRAATARAAAEHWQSEGQWGKRDFDKAVFNLPIPLYNPATALHRDLADAAGRAEALAARVALKEGEHFTRTRKRIRAALIADGVAGEIEAMIGALIGIAPAATLAGDTGETEADDAD